MQWSRFYLVDVVDGTRVDRPKLTVGAEGVGRGRINPDMSSTYSKSIVDGGQRKRQKQSLHDVQRRRHRFTFSRLATAFEFEFGWIIMNY